MKKFKLTKLFKENFKTIIAIIITTLLVGGTTAFASYNYFAKDVEYVKSNGTKINVEEALNKLYMNKKEMIKVDSCRLETVRDIRRTATVDLKEYNNYKDISIDDIYLIIDSVAPAARWFWNNISRFCKIRKII